MEPEKTPIYQRTFEKEDQKWGQSYIPNYIAKL